MTTPKKTQDAVGRTVQLPGGSIGIVQSAYFDGIGMSLLIRIIGYATPHPSLGKPAHMTAVQEDELRNVTYADDVDAGDVYWFPSKMRTATLAIELLADGDRILHEGIVRIVTGPATALSDHIHHYRIECEGAEGPLSFETKENTVQLVASAWPNRPEQTEAAKILSDDVGTTRWGVPEVGDFVLIPNAGGRHQSPGSYGYARTEVLGVETRPNDPEVNRVTTRKYGTGCWTTGESLICVTEPAQ